MSAHECTQQESIKKIEKTLFVGNGHPSVMTQLATINQKLNALCWVAGILASAVIVQGVARMFKG